MTSIQNSQLLNVKPSDFQQNYRQRLKLQNIQLHVHIFQLEEQVNEVLSKKQIKKMKNDQLQNQLIQLYGQEINEQSKKIKRLKEQVYYLKSSNSKINSLYINKEQDQLLILIKQRDQLLRQKQIFKSSIKDKNLTLGRHNGLDSHKKQLERQYGQTKKLNQKYSSQIVQIERQIRKYHYVSETTKDQKNTKQQVASPQNKIIQLNQINQQIQALHAQIKSIDSKWKPSINSLDSEYFSISYQQKQKKKDLQKLLKQLKIYQLRSKSLRDEARIQEDRNLLSKIATSNSFQELIKSSQQIKKKKNQKELRIQSTVQITRKQRLKQQFILKQREKIKVKRNNSQHHKLISEGDINKEQPYRNVNNLKNNIQKQVIDTKFNRSLTHGELSQRIKLYSKKQDKKQSQLKVTENTKQKISNLKLGFKLISPKKNQNKMQQESFMQNMDKQKVKVIPELGRKGQFQHKQKAKHKQKQNFLQKQLKQQTIQTGLKKKQNKKKISLNYEILHNKLQQPEISSNILIQTSKQKQMSHKKRHIKSSTQKSILEKALSSNIIQKNKKVNKFKQKINFQIQVQSKIDKKQMNLDNPIKKLEQKRQKHENLEELQLQVIKQNQIKKIEIKLQNKPSAFLKAQIKKQNHLQNGQNDSQSIAKYNIQQEHSGSKQIVNNSVQKTQSHNEDINQTFKPYLIKRKRPAGAFNFQSTYDQSKRKAQLLQFIEKKSIGVGNQTGS